MVYEETVPGHVITCNRAVRMSRAQCSFYTAHVQFSLLLPVFTLLLPIPSGYKCYGGA